MFGDSDLCIFFTRKPSLSGSYLNVEHVLRKLIWQNPSNETLHFGNINSLFFHSLYFWADYWEIAIWQNFWWASCGWFLCLHLNKGINNPLDTRCRFNVNTISYEVVSTLKRRRVSTGNMPPTVVQHYRQLIIYAGSNPSQLYVRSIYTLNFYLLDMINKRNQRKNNSYFSYCNFVMRYIQMLQNTRKQKFENWYRMN